MDQARLNEQSAAASGRGTDLSSALIARDRYVTNHMARVLNHSSQLRIAELSVGDGRMAMAILNSFPSGHLTCADISNTRLEALSIQIEQTCSLSSHCPQFISCNFDTEFEQFASNSYDVVIALDIMEHVLDVFGFIENCSRILAKGGILYLRVPNIAYAKHRLKLLCGRLPVTASWFGKPNDLTAWRRHGWDGGHLHLFTLPILRRLIQESCLSIEECQDPGTRFSNLRRIWPNLLFANPLVIARKA